MNIITQPNLFSVKEIEKLGDIERLLLCCKGLENKEKQLMLKLNKQRKKGRRDFPNEVLFRCLIAMKIYGHPTVASFRRELLRNAQLRVSCGLMDDAYENKQRKSLVPSVGVFSRFIKRLMEHLEDVEALMNSYVEQMYELVDGFGEIVAGDGKIITAYAPRKKIVEGQTDNRSENDATYTKKTYHGVDANGKTYSKTTTYLGFRVHAIVDAKTELPISTVVLPANISEGKQMREQIQALPVMPHYILLDRGYDAQETLNLCRTNGIVPIIDNRVYTKGESVQYKNTRIYYDEKCNVYYDDEAEMELQPMKYVGYDKHRNAIRYMYKGKVYRLLIKENPKVFNQVARNSKKFKKLYAMRTSVERYNGRLDRDYMFENHCIRGLKKMSLMVTLTNIIMLAMAEARIQHARKHDKKPQHLASLTRLIS